MNEEPKAETPNPGIALALGSAFLGIYAHGGFLCGLNKAGVFPGHVAGASAGAMAGGFYASGMRGAELEAENPEPSPPTRIAMPAPSWR